MKTVRCTLGLFVVAVALTGCAASMSDQTCRTTNWYTRGVEDGTRGRPNAALEDYTKDCSEHRISPDRNAWFWGHAKGLTTYCADGPGYDVGRRGMEYQNACAGRPGEVEFLLGSLRGLSDRREVIAQDLTELRSSLGSTLSRTEAEALMRRDLLLQADYNRAQALGTWMSARLSMLTGAPP